MISDFFKRSSWNDVLFQQNDTTCQAYVATIDLLFQRFDGCLNGDANGPPRGCYLMALNYFLWDVVKEMCYHNKLETNEHLKLSIRDAIAEI